MILPENSTRYFLSGVLYLCTYLKSKFFFAEIFCIFTLAINKPLTSRNIDFFRVILIIKLVKCISTSNFLAFLAHLIWR